tara:strand:- start:5143 stop:6492 length:1350 start_codon:yes stop_codon:yes gene_type:complete
MFEYKKEVWKVGKLLAEYGNIDTQPIGQRLDRDPVLIGKSKPSKAQGIINSMLMGIDIGQITIHETPEGDYDFESIDGGHRKRYIKAFIANKFPDFKSGKLLREMSPEERQKFFDIELTFTIYKPLQGHQVGLIFRSLNETTPVNHQEMLNSYGDTPIANVIRETVRVIPGVGNDIHPLFEYSQSPGSTKKNYGHIQFDNKGLRIDEMVARLFYIETAGNGLGPSTDKHLEVLYESNPADVSKIKEKVYENLDFVLKMSNIRKRRYNRTLTQREFVFFYRLWLYLKETYTVFKIHDYENFFDTIHKEFSVYQDKYDSQPVRLQGPSPFDSTKTIGKQFNDCLTEFDKDDHVYFPIQQILETVDISTLITIKDKKRAFSTTQKERKLAEQNFKCAIDGKSLAMVDAEAGHIDAHAKGGLTVYDNLAMIRKDYNGDMGTMSVEEYKLMMNL